jgi:drug/metabolite transporter (DMT)-like permease
MVASTFFFALVGAGVKALSGRLPDGVIVFFRSAVALAVMLPGLRAAGGMSTRRPAAHLLRSLAGFGSLYLCFFSIARMPLGDAMLLCYTSPLFMPFLSSVWIGEKASAAVWGAVAVGFLGVALVMKPGSGLFSPAALAALASGFFGAVAQVGIRDLVDTEPPFRIAFYYTAFAACASALPLPWTWKSPSGADGFVLAGIGAAAAVAQVLLTWAYRHASPADAGPFMYGAVVFSAGWDWLLWRRRPDALSLAGAALIIFSGVLVLRVPARRETVPA